MKLKSLISQRLTVNTKIETLCKPIKKLNSQFLTISIRKVHSKISKTHILLTLSPKATLLKFINKNKMKINYNKLKNKSYSKNR